MKTFLAQTVEQWRAWLAKHHHTESEVWLIFYKRHLESLRSITRMRWTRRCVLVGSIV